MAKDFIVFYDWDGTLIDSLPAHVKFLRDVNKQYKCGLSMPDPHETEKCKKLVNSTSMHGFVTTAGLPKELVPEIMELYVKEFSKNPRYHSELFPGVQGMIKNLADMGIRQGIISANYRQNFEHILKKENLNNFFYPIADRIELDKIHSGKKSEYLKFYRGDNDLFPEEMVYVGDTSHDYKAALDAEIPFIGTSYGWEFSPGQKTPFPLVDSVKDLERKIIELSKS